MYFHRRIPESFWEHEAERLSGRYPVPALQTLSKRPPKPLGDSQGPRNQRND